MRSGASASGGRFAARFDPRLLLLRRAVVTMAAALASFFTLWFAGLPLAVGVTPAVLAVVLTITFSRTESRATESALLQRFLLIPLVAVAATGVAWLFSTVFAVGAVLFILGLSLAIWVRRFGPRATRLGTVLSLPLMAVLIVPVQLPRSLPAWLAIVISVVAALVAVAWVEVLQWVARITGFLPRRDLEASARMDAAADGVADSPSPSAVKAEPARPAAAPTNTAPAAARVRRRILPSTRMAVQLAVALAAAFVIGKLVFPDHWGWVVLTAFIVCAGNRGRGDVVYKSILRVAGAIAGTVAVVALTEALGATDGTTVTVTIFTILFFALWLRDINYAFWAAGVTVILALLQSATGATALTTGPFLGERIVAIVVGALCGILASWFLLPVRTEAVVRRRLADALAALSVTVHPSTDRSARLEALDRFERELTRVEQVARSVRAHRGFTRPWHRAPHQAELIAAVAALEPLVEELIARLTVELPPTQAEPALRKPGRARLGDIARAVGAARRALASPSAAADSPAASGSDTSADKGSKAGMGSDTGTAATSGTEAAIAAIARVRTLLLDTLVDA